MGDKSKRCFYTMLAVIKFLMVDQLTNCFINGFGIQQSECFLELASKDGNSLYKIWFDVDFECQLKTLYKSKGLSDYEISLLTLNRTMNLRVRSISTDQDNSLRLVVETGIDILIKGSLLIHLNHGEFIKQTL